MNKILSIALLCLFCLNCFSQQYYFDRKGNPRDESAVYHTDTLCPMVFDKNIELDQINQLALEKYNLHPCEYCTYNTKYKSCEKTYIPRFFTKLTEYDYSEQKIDSTSFESDIFFHKVFDNNVLISVFQEVPNQEKIGMIVAAHVAENIDKAAIVISAVGTVASAAKKNWKLAEAFADMEHHYALQYALDLQTDYYNGLSRCEESLDIMVEFTNFGTQEVTINDEVNGKVWHLLPNMSLSLSTFDLMNGVFRIEYSLDPAKKVSYYYLDVQNFLFKVKPKMIEKEYIYLMCPPVDSSTEHYIEADNMSDKGLLPYKINRKDYTYEQLSNDEFERILKAK